jgi:16S rRNA processing protein RimM
VIVGRVRTTYGLRGLLKAMPLCDDPGRFAELAEVCVEFEDGKRELHKVTGVAGQGADLRIALEGVHDRSAAERFRHAMLLIRPEMRRELPEGAYYIGDLRGLEVVTTDGRSLGTIQDVLLLPANDVYVTEHALIPAVREIVLSVDLEAGKVTVEPIEGLAPELGV